MKTSHPGLFIAFEGGDACGKTTQLRHLREYLSSLGHDVLTTHQPGGTPLGLDIRRSVLHADYNLTPMAEALLYAADKAQHVAEVIRPALEAGKTVLTDRYTDSSIAYQGFGRQLGAPFIRSLNDKATGGLTPNLTILLDLPVEVAFERLHRTGRKLDNLESAGYEFHTRMRNAMLRIAADDPWHHVIIDATPDEQTVTTAVRNAVDAVLAALVAA